MSETGDFYELLGVEKDADNEQIKRSYRRLAIRYHPDKNPGDEVAALKFQDLARAHDVLTNPEKRKVYDEFGEEGLEKLDAANSFSPAHSPGSDGGRSLIHELKVPLSLIFTGGDHSVTFMQQTICPTCAGQGLTGPRELCVTCGGTRAVLVKRSVSVSIPCGASDGETIILEGMGDRHPDNPTPPGDVKLVIKARPHPVFRRRGSDLVTVRTVTLADAVGGAKLTIKALDGTRLSIATPPGDVLAPGRCHVVGGAGLPLRHNNTVFGDLLVFFLITFPPTTSPQVREAAAKMRRTATCAVSDDDEPDPAADSGGDDTSKPSLPSGFEECEVVEGFTIPPCDLFRVMHREKYILPDPTEQFSASPRKGAGVPSMSPGSGAPPGGGGGRGEGREGPLFEDEDEDEEDEGQQWEDGALPHHRAADLRGMDESAPPSGGGGGGRGRDGALPPHMAGQGHPRGAGGPVPPVGLSTAEGTHPSVSASPPPTSAGPSARYPSTHASSSTGPSGGAGAAGPSPRSQAAGPRPPHSGDAYSHPHASQSPPRPPHSAQGGGPSTGIHPHAGGHGAYPRHPSHPSHPQYSYSHPASNVHAHPHAHAYARGAGAGGPMGGPPHPPPHYPHPGHPGAHPAYRGHGGYPGGPHGPPTHPSHGAYASHPHAHAHAHMHRGHPGAHAGGPSHPGHGPPPHAAYMRAHGAHPGGAGNIPPYAQGPGGYADEDEDDEEDEWGSVPPMVAAAMQAAGMMHPGGGGGGVYVMRQDGPRGFSRSGGEEAVVVEVDGDEDEVPIGLFARGGVSCKAHPGQRAGHAVVEELPDDDDGDAIPPPPPPPRQ